MKKSVALRGERSVTTAQGKVRTGSIERAQKRLGTGNIGIVARKPTSARGGKMTAMRTDRLENGGGPGLLAAEPPVINIGKRMTIDHGDEGTLTATEIVDHTPDPPHDHGLGHLVQTDTTGSIRVATDPTLSTGHKKIAGHRELQENPTPNLHDDPPHQHPTLTRSKPSSVPFPPRKNPPYDHAAAALSKPIPWASNHASPRPTTHR